jgi:outer membrane protein assembly factor BamB
LNAKDGSIKWRRKVDNPIRSAPVVKEGRVFVVSINNQLESLGIETGKILWTHTGIMETAGLLGGASPALEGDVIVVPYSSGEVYALRVENGHSLWSENLATGYRLDAVSALAHIRAQPVIDLGLVFLISHSGQMMAIDLRSGQKVWSHEISGINSPAVAGEFIYVMTNLNQLLCMIRSNGYIKWVNTLPLYTDERNKSDRIIWSGPILAGGRLILTGSNGEMIEVSALNGEEIKRLNLPSPSHIAPIVADNTLLCLTDHAEIVAFQ